VVVSAFLRTFLGTGSLIAGASMDVRTGAMTPIDMTLYETEKQAADRFEAIIAKPAVLYRFVDRIEEKFIPFPSLIGAKTMVTTFHLADVGTDERLLTESVDVDPAGRQVALRKNERMWSDGEPIDPSPTIDQAINGGVPWLEIPCAWCKTPNDVDLAAIRHPPTTFVHDLASRWRCRKCAKAGRRPPRPCSSLAGSRATLELKPDRFRRKTGGTRNTLWFLRKDFRT
jgi:hypothetical protein